MRKAIAVVIPEASLCGGALLAHRAIPATPTAVSKLPQGVKPHQLMAAEYKDLLPSLNLLCFSALAGHISVRNSSFDSRMHFAYGSARGHALT